MGVIRKAYVDVGDKQIHYRHMAGGGPSVVMFHQTASSSLMYVKTMERLDGQYDLYALDTPGFGGSFDPEGEPPMSQYAQWMYEAIQGLGLSQCHLVGHHTGSCIAVEIAARHPEIVQSLTMVGPVVITEEERSAYSKVLGPPFEPTISGSYLLDNWDYLRNLAGSYKDAQLLHREMADMLRAWWGRVLAYRAVWEQDFTSFYTEIGAPMMIMAAPDDVLYPAFERARELRPDAEAPTVSGANFEPDLDPDTFAAHLRDFFGRHAG